ncbi:MAG: 50S ribosomal protein L29 [Gammaproteobacteria bacterium]|nr:50S ribosomal protein L29 [Gammaproteobacteria bacterium]
MSAQKLSAADLRGKSAKELQDLLVEKLREQFNQRMQRGSGQPTRPSMVKEVRRDIARIHTVMNEQKQAGKAS